MTTSQAILQVSEKDAPLLFGEVLQYGLNVNRKVVPDGLYYHSFCEDGNTCEKCGKFVIQDVPYCEIPDPIAATPANAFKWRDWCVEKYGDGFYIESLMTVCNEAASEKDKAKKFTYLEVSVYLAEWLAVKCQPLDILKAVCLTVIAAKENSVDKKG